MNETAAASTSSVDGADGDPVLVGEDVRRSYGDVVALDGVDLRVEAGEVFPGAVSSAGTTPRSRPRSHPS
jgi:ABC-2 type transport system ATP-binding protein